MAEIFWDRGFVMLNIIMSSLYNEYSQLRIETINKRKDEIVKELEEDILELNKKLTEKKNELRKSVLQRTATKKQT